VALFGIIPMQRPEGEKVAQRMQQITVDALSHVVVQIWIWDEPEPCFVVGTSCNNSLASIWGQPFLARLAMLYWKWVLQGKPTSSRESLEETLY